ncbi:MAG: SGNH/GDSL hydrolase family protein, partial [Gemmatimonadales bacterium]
APSHVLPGAIEPSVTDNRTTRGWSRRLAGNIALAGAGLVASLVVCELLLRLLGISYPVFVRTDPVRGVAHIPGVKSGWVEINSDGWRGPEVALKPPAGTLRIALLGDSYIEAFEVPFEKTAGQVLEHRLSALRGAPVEVLNFGEGGYGTGQELLTLQHEVWKYSPDLVLLAFTPSNDVSDNYRPLKRTDYVPYFVYRGDTLVLDSSFLRSKGYQGRTLGTRHLLDIVQHSRLAQLVNRVRHLSRKGERQQRNAAGSAGDEGEGPGDEMGLNDEVLLPPPTPDWKEAWRVTAGLLRVMHADCRKHHTPFAIVTLTRGVQVTPVAEQKEKFLRHLGAKDLYYPERRLAEFGKAESIPVLNLAPPMAQQAEERHVYLHAHQGVSGVGHWNEEGNRVAGELIASWLGGRLADSSGTGPTPDLTAR